MVTTKLTACMVVKNEEQWVWYAIQSVIDYVDALIIFDTGSTDNTKKIIASFPHKKIHFEEKGKVNAEKLVHLRNEQIKLVRTPWFLLLDGDEVWPHKSIKSLLTLLSGIGEAVMGIVVKARLPLGDLYHYQEERAGKYKLLGKTGHYNIRTYRVKKEYEWKGIYPLEAYVDKKGNAINEQESKLVMLKGKEYWHLRHLSRSAKRGFKREVGERQYVLLPEVFFEERPTQGPSPWVHFSVNDVFISQILTPLRKMKRNRGI